MRPRTRSAFESSSSNPRTTTTSAWTPSGVAPVPTLSPRPSITIGCRSGSTISALSLPRTHLGTFTPSVCTFSRPSRFISLTAHSMARSSAGVPLRRLPMVSVSTARRCQANALPTASPIRRDAGSRYWSSQLDERRSAGAMCGDCAPIVETASNTVDAASDTKGTERVTTTRRLMR